MAELETILRAHAARYPAMEPRDAVKLVYQGAYGGDHLIADPLASLRILQEERARTEKTPGAPLFEDIGGGLVRLDLSAAEAFSDEAINRAFVASARLTRGTQALLSERLAVLSKMTEAGVFRFSGEALERYLSAYRVAGCPAVRHSEAYRAAYRPAYRVLDRRFAALLPVLDLAVRRNAGRARTVIALEGNAAAGKTTAASLLKLALEPGTASVAMDDFFLPAELRTAARYGEPGGNVHYERFFSEVVEPLRAGAPQIVYRVFDCKTMAYAGVKHAGRAPYWIVEGSYSLHPAFGDYADVSVFLSVDPGEQARRIRARDGEERYARFLKEWIPMERNYFDAFGIEKRCDLTVRL